jgi:ribonuclease G
MKKEIIINSTPQEARVALVENGVLVEAFVERKKDQGVLGNIYKGRVLKVLPGMQAAFVDIGLPKAGFLYVADIQALSDEYETFFVDDKVAGHEEGTVEKAGGESEDVIGEIPLRIEEMLREGQEIIVQIAKEPLGTKGARLTSRVALPGRYLVYLPMEDHVGISRRIVDEEERERLRKLTEGLKPTPGGLIVRTVGEKSDEAEFREDLDFLVKLWKKIREKGDKSHAPHLIHSDLDILLKTVRDHFTEDVDRLVIDNDEDYHRLVEFSRAFLPHLRPKIEVYQGTEPIFDAYDVEIELGKVLERKVWLKSGGYIIIEQTEALTAVDVNTGKFVGRGSFEDTILKTNLEAAREIAYQLRLRNLGGIIIIDFIDMEKEKNRERVSKALEEALRGDRATTKILQISELGLVEMTRKRSRPPLERSLSQWCPYCKGRAQIKSAQTVSNEILREIARTANLAGGRSIVIEAHPTVADILTEDERQHIETMERDLGRSIVIKSNPALHHEEYTLTPLQEAP